VIVYVESNFVLELALRQEEHEACTRIVSLAKRGRIQLVVPAFSLAEPLETLTRRHRQRRELQRTLSVEFAQLRRSRSYQARAIAMSEVNLLLVESEKEEQARLARTRAALLKTAEIIPLTADILRSATASEIKYVLTAQDAIVYASVRGHLDAGSGRIACFLNKNVKDFDLADIRDELADFGCKLIPSFRDGLAFIKSKLAKKTGR
jgi:predicted nucleic acid-binding protein